jgi:UDP-3-O-[3-hydroxymyristoyl] N-acetylglucosamine deacetylase/3-hydroxyacyl-[acyl-carrier-protein] dehydratase
VSGLDIDNVRIEIDGPEPPAGDGSAGPFADALLEAGIATQEAPREVYVVEEPVVVEKDGARVVALPLDPASNGGSISSYGYSLSYRGSSLAQGYREVSLGRESFMTDLSRARTFCMARDVERLKAIGLGRGATRQNTLVIEDDRAQETELRFEDEPVRHKIVDMIGDVGLAGAPVAGRILGFRSGHRQNWMLVQHIVKKVAKRPVTDVARPTVMGMDEIQRILPHRFPFLLVDRVIELVPNERILAVKNVCMNEDFFRGHWPENPVMPGVLQVEALAQAAGLLLSQYVRSGGKMAALAGLDRVKLRRPVVPGDRLLLDVRVKKIRRTLGVCEGTATVGGEVTAEANLLFGLIRGDEAAANGS